MRYIIASAALSLSLAACSSGEDGSGSRSNGGEIKDVSACNEAAGPLRETFLILDPKVIVKTESATETAAKNSWIRDLFVDIADPVKSLASGFSVANEKVTVVVLSSDGSSGTRVFTGCIPGAASAENGQKSAVDEFFTGSSENKLKEQQDNFRTRLIGGLQGAASKGEEGMSRHSGSLSQSKVFESLRNSRGIFEGGKAVRRFVIVTDLGGIDTPDGAIEQNVKAGAFAAGVAEGYNSAFDFGLGYVHLVQPQESSLPNRSYLEGFFLAQSAELLSLAKGKVGSGSPVPETVKEFKGSAMYPSGAHPLVIRLGHGPKGELVSAWLTLQGDKPQALPMIGNWACHSKYECEYSSRNGKFSQSWSVAPGGEPEFDNDMPFGGMRDFKFNLQNDSLRGKVSDILVGDVGNGENFVQISATLVGGAK